MSKTVFRIEIEMGNDAMRTVLDIWRALRGLRPAIIRASDDGSEKAIMDVNGNRVGKVGFYQE